MNKNIKKYRVYQIEGGNWNLLAELNTNIFEYYHKNEEVDKNYSYALAAVDNENSEGPPAQTSVQ